MAEPLRIVCPCGYENWVPEEKRGQIVPCFICGQDLVVEEPAAEESSASTEAAIEAAPSTSSTKSGARSPFEADELESAVRPKFQHAPPTPTAAPPLTGRPRSPFEADGPNEADFPQDEQVKLVAGPFSLKAEPAPKQGPSVIDEMEKLRPKVRRDQHVVVHTISPHDAPTGEKCPQCGREFRGSWDKVETSAGVLCYICSNQGTHGVPERILKTEPKRTNELREHELLMEPAQAPGPPIDGPWWRDTHSQGFKNAIAWLAFGMVFFAFIIWLTGWGTPDTNTLSAAARQAKAAELEKTMPGWVPVLYWSWQFVGGFLSMFLAMYFTLSRNQHLPYDSLRMNVLYLGAVMALLAVLAIGGFVSWVLLKDIFVAGKIWFLFVLVIVVLVHILLLIRLLDFSNSDFLWLFFVFLPISQFIVQGVGLFLSWGLYAASA